MNRLSTAHTLDELLSYHDQDFVFCAYITLLGREPDPEGLRYYLARVRQGVGKIEILSQLRLSPEGKARGASPLAGLDAVVTPYRYLKLPVIGSLLGFLIGVQGPGVNHQKLNAIENQICVLGDENRHRFVQLEQAMASLHHVVMQQVHSVGADLGDASNPSEVAAATDGIRPPEFESLKQLSPRAREIYLQLKKSAAIHAKGVA